MSTVRIFLLALLCLPFCYNAPLPAQPAKEEAVGKRVAFLVGVNKYKKPGFPNLEYAERDVEKLGEEIDKRLKFDKVVVLKGDDATRENIEKQLKSMVGPLGENDLILVALSGHGLQFEVNGKEEGYFCPVDAVVPDKAQPLGENLFGMEALIGLLKKNVGKKLILVDACRNEPPLPGKGAKGLEGKNDLELPSNTAVFFSCSARQQSWENEKAGGGHSVFTHCVLEALRGGAVKNGSLSWTDLVGYVEERMADDDIRQLLPRAQSPVESKKLGRTLLARSLGGMKIEPKREPLVEGKEPKPGEERAFDVGNGVKMAFCWIPGTNGTATLGSPKGESKREAHEAEHEVELDGFWMAKTEMTQGQYVKLTGKKNPSRFCADGYGKEKVQGKNTNEFPVETVSWDDVQECIKGMMVPLGMKRVGLPTEAQWEWACRGGKGNGRAFYFGDALNGDKANSDGNYPYGTTKGTSLEQTEKVGSYAAEAPHPWGLSDMHGNVWEWCEDSIGDRRVLRGGSWGSRPADCRSACRNNYAPDNRNSYNGFRVVLLP